MSIGTDLGEALKSAMRAKEADRVACIRQVRAKIQETVNAVGFEGEINDDLHRKIISTYVKSLAKAIHELLPAGNRSQDLRDKYAAEINYLEQYLPERLGEGETRALVASTLAELAVTDSKQAGRVIGAIMKGHKDEVDAALVRRIVEESLEKSN